MIQMTEDQLKALKLLERVLRKILFMNLCPVMTLL